MVEGENGWGRGWLEEGWKRKEIKGGWKKRIYLFIFFFPKNVKGENKYWWRKLLRVGGWLNKGPFR